MRILLILLCLGLVGCQNRLAQKLVKAKAAPVSKFLDQRLQMQAMRHRMPVHYVWKNPDPKVEDAVRRATEIYIAPVEMRYLRPVSKALANWEMENGWTRPAEADIARELRRRFMLAFLKSPAPRFRLVKHPTPRCIILELAVTELNPTSVSGNGVKLAAKFFVGPLSGLLSVFTKGNIAIEGKVTLPDTRPPVSYLQFSDNEKDKMTFYSVRDFQPYAHARIAADEWARQFEEFTRTAGQHTVKESSFFTLKPW